MVNNRPSGADNEFRGGPGGACTGFCMTILEFSGEILGLSRKILGNKNHYVCIEVVLAVSVVNLLSCLIIARYLVARLHDAHDVCRRCSF